jgi:hypothetical protein
LTLGAWGLRLDPIALLESSPEPRRLWNRKDAKGAKISAKKNSKKILAASLRLCVFSAIAFSDDEQETAAI